VGRIGGLCGTLSTCELARPQAGQCRDEWRIFSRFCSVSHNHGASWTEQRVSNSNWLPIHHADGLINRTYIGDYDTLTSDFLLGKDGFFGTFEIQTNGNPDVFAKKF